jgi:uncharacterized OB-fold protein
MSVASYTREIPRHHRLEAGKCVKCGAVHYPARQVCPKCGGREFETIRLSREGKVVTFTVIRVAPANFTDQVPYAMGVVELDHGARLLTQITDCDLDEVKIGMPVKMEFRKIFPHGEEGIIEYGFKAVPR